MPQGDQYALASMGSATSFTRAATEAIVVVLDTSGSMASPAFPAAGGAVNTKDILSRTAAVNMMYHAFANRSAAYNHPHVVGLVTCSSKPTLACAVTESWRKCVGGG